MRLEKVLLVVWLVTLTSWACKSDSPVTTSDGVDTSAATEPDTEVRPSAADSNGTTPPTSDGEPSAKLAVADPELKLAPKTPTRGVLVVDQFLAEDDLRKTLQTNDTLVKSELQGIQPSAEYNSVRYRLAGADPKHYGVALQVWAVSGDKAEARYELHRKTYKDAKDSPGVGAKSIAAKRGRILHRSWMVTKTSQIATLTCDERLCSPLQLLNLAKKVDKRLSEAE